jgi:BirA family biotin operon repressor/biotin-[acetyl-CoA-carboxylase] ligase
LADQGEAEGLFVVAGRQTAGRGRHGRSWLSPSGNLYASLLLRPRRSLAEAASLSLVAALALAETIEALAAGRVRPRVKWPNDVQIAGAKIAGILLEAAADGRGGCDWVVAGIGVNLAWAPEGEVRYPTTHLAACGIPVPPPREFLTALAGPLRRRLDLWGTGGFAPLRPAWLARAVGIGDSAELKLGAEAIRGRLVDVDDEGAVLIERVGRIERHTAGELLLA